MFPYRINNFTNAVTAIFFLKIYIISRDSKGKRTGKRVYSGSEAGEWQGVVEGPQTTLNKNKLSLSSV